MSAAATPCSGPKPRSSTRNAIHLRTIVSASPPTGTRRRSSSSAGTRASSTQSLLKSQARVYIVGGMKDTSVPILSGEAMAAELLGAGHDVTLRRIPNAGHNLLPAGAAAGNMWPEYQRIVEWYARDLSKPAVSR